MAVPERRIGPRTATALLLVEGLLLAGSGDDRAARPGARRRAVGRRDRASW